MVTEKTIFYLNTLTSRLKLFFAILWAAGNYAEFGLRWQRLQTIGENSSF